MTVVPAGFVLAQDLADGIANKPGLTPSKVPLLQGEELKQEFPPVWMRKILSLPLEGSVQRGPLGFLVIRIVLFVVLTAVAGLRVSADVHHYFWFVPCMGFVGCMIPSAGIPVAGSIIFMPLLLMAGVKPDACVAFGTATQAVGVGIFAPLGWFLKKPSVFLLPVFAYAIPGGCLGLAAGLLLFPMHGAHVTFLFVVFCAAVAAHTTHGLYSTMATDSEELQIGRLSVKLQVLSCCFAGGLMNAWIGIGLEKVLFVLLTFHGGDVLSASVTGITITGLLSFATAIRNAVNGTFPLELWLMVLPGILAGSILGPWVNEALGKRNILVCFVVLLVLDIVRMSWGPLMLLMHA